MIFADYLRRMVRLTRPFLFLSLLALGVAGCSVQAEVQRVASPTPSSVAANPALPTAAATTTIPATTPATVPAPPAVTPSPVAPTTTASSSAPTTAAGLLPTATTVFRPMVTMTPTAVPAAPPPATPKASVAPSTPPTVASAAIACRTVDLSAEIVWDAAAGSRNGTITITNGGAACTLPGLPTVQVQNAAGQVLPVTQENEALDEATGIAAVTLRPRSQALLLIRWSNYCGPKDGEPLKLLIALPTGAGLAPQGAVSIPPCLGEGQASRLGVQPLRLGDPAATVVQDFYNAINNRDYRAAYGFRGADYQTRQSYDDFAAGYAGTGLVMAFVTDVAPTGEGQWTVAVRIAARQSDQTMQHFSGSYQIAREGGALKIVAADITPQ